ncbi:hypothetical protein [Lentilitoribacter sp. EG35]|uniref:hypothetical protein n=1 Tax=Lentilitoribacter sp. EG35 TaxID=3234192 RepID=UPI0034616128
MNRFMAAQSQRDTLIFCLYLLIAFIVLVGNTAHASDQNIIDMSDAFNCPQGRHMQPNGPFAVDIYCDDALGTNIAVMLVKMSAPFQGEYSLTNRVWQGDNWAASASSIIWSDDPNEVYVSTDSVYGTGSIYKLQLLEQTSELIWKMESGCVPALKAVSVATLRVEILPCSEGETDEIIIPIK